MRLHPIVLGTILLVAIPLAIFGLPLIVEVGGIGISASPYPRFVELSIVGDILMLVGGASVAIGFALSSRKERSDIKFEEELSA